MKTVRVKIPGGPTIRINEYETPLSVVDRQSAREFDRQLKHEKEYDQRLEEMAKEIAQKIAVAEGDGDRALAYWEAGKVMRDHILKLNELEGLGQAQRYMGHGRTRERLMEKVAEVSGREISPHYFRKFERFAELLTREQAERNVPYSLQHELIYSWLTKDQRDHFLDQCERGEITTNVHLREEVKKLRPKGERIVDDFDSPT